MKIARYVVPVKYRENENPLTNTLQHTHFAKLCYNEL